MSTTIPVFFVPGASPDTLEATYAEFARLARRPVPPPDARVFSITFQNNNEEWTATVGHTLRGLRRRVRRSGKVKYHTEEPLSDSALVLAIFPGTPYKVVTNALFSAVESAWDGLFMATPATEIFFPVAS